MAQSTLEFGVSRILTMFYLLPATAFFLISIVVTVLVFFGADPESTHANKLMSQVLSKEVSVTIYISVVVINAATIIWVLFQRDTVPFYKQAEIFEDKKLSDIIKNKDYKQIIKNYSPE